MGTILGFSVALLLGVIDTEGIKDREGSFEGAILVDGDRKEGMDDGTSEGLSCGESVPSPPSASTWISPAQTSLPL